VSMKGRILVAMSGGVDSSVAAALLSEAGYEVVGATMKTFCYSEVEGPGKTCCGLDGITDARRVADTLGIPHYVYDVEEDFTRDVIGDFVSEYAHGRTPNPCVRCNSNTKFRDLLGRGRLLGCDGIASGHYVWMDRGGPELRLRRGTDAEKDQSYFLWGLPREMLSLLYFPLGRLTKDAVRARARALGLVTADKPESQEICFVPTGNYRDFLQKRLRDRHPALEPGPIVTVDGTEIGEHAGYANYTVGQRKGLPGGRPEPLYVVEIRAARREIVVGSYGDCFAAGVEVAELNWLCDPPQEGAEVDVQIRYRAPAVQATVNGIGESLTLVFREPQQAVTPGQSAVLFEDDVVLGGGRIVRAMRAAEAPALA
jgi:tRNA-uridine 2-sulfurtransferase